MTPWRVLECTAAARTAALSRCRDAGVYRELATARPEAFRPALAWSLSNLAWSLGDLGRREDALAASEEAVTIHREPAKARPDTFRSNLEQSLRVGVWLERGEGLTE